MLVRWLQHNGFFLRWSIVFSPWYCDNYSLFRRTAMQYFLYTVVGKNSKNLYCVQFLNFYLTFFWFWVAQLRKKQSKPIASVISALKTDTCRCCLCFEKMLKNCFKCTRWPFHVSEWTSGDKTNLYLYFFIIYYVMYITNLADVSMINYTQHSVHLCLSNI